MSSVLHWCSRGRLAAAMALVGIGTFVFRWLAFDLFQNDHFDHVARARQVLLGEWPVRDFVDPGLPLMYLLSAAAHVVVGAPLLAEALLFVSGFAVAAALSVRAATLATGSLTVALFAVSLQVAAYPRSYGYPKLLVYALAITVGWWAVERLSLKRLGGLAAVTALSYYFRHDHGVYVAFGSLVLLAVHLWPQGLWRVVRTSAAYVGLTAAFVLPHLAYVEYHGGLASYFAVGAEYSRVEAAVNPREVPSFALDSVLANSVPFLFWLCWLMPIVGVALLMRADTAAVARMREQGSKIAMVVALAVAVNVGLVRSSVAAHLPEVAVPQTILGAWLLVTLWRWPAAHSARAVVRAALVACAAVTAVAVGAAFGARDHVLQTGVWLGPGEVVTRMHELADDLRDERPDVLPGTARAFAPFFQYVRQCTAEDDRFLFIGYQPEVFVIAGRGFAGGHIFFFNQFNAAPEHQALTVERLTRESVPFVLVPPANRDHFEEVFGDVSRYVEARYRPMASIGGEAFPVDVLVEMSREPASTHEPTGWPCFTPRGA